ncbi:MAG: hypothetical protein CMH49_05105 [Myxococcales bacterium]|nr:hypothetical protein [Myxococcales bacterium]
MKHLSSKSLILSIFIFIAACSPPREDPSVVAYRTAISYLSMGTSDALWNILAKASKKHLNQILNRELEDFSVPDKLELELDWAFESPFAGQATLYTKDQQGLSDQERLIHTVYASQSWIIPVVLEEGTWRVHLLGARLLSPNHILP